MARPTRVSCHFILPVLEIRQCRDMDLVFRLLEDRGVKGNNTEARP